MCTVALPAVAKSRSLEVAHHICETAIFPLDPDGVTRETDANMPCVIEIMKSLAFETAKTVLCRMYSTPLWSFHVRCEAIRNIGYNVQFQNVYASQMLSSVGGIWLCRRRRL